jgi:hypothetical protein
MQRNAQDAGEYGQYGWGRDSMNGTFQLIQRARREAAAARYAPMVTASPGLTHVRTAAPDQIALTRSAEEPIHTGSIYRGLMQKHDRMGTRHLR